MAVLTLIAATYTVSFFLYNAGPNPLFVGGGCAIVLLAKLFCDPKCLDVTPETVKFSYWQVSVKFWWNTSQKIRHLHHAEPAHEKSHTLYNIKSIEYLQSPLEKLFSCGHIRICGDVDTNNGEKEQRTFVIHGLKDFVNTSAWMRDYIKLSNHN